MGRLWPHSVTNCTFFGREAARRHERARDRDSDPHRDNGAATLAWPDGGNTPFKGSSLWDELKGETNVRPAKTSFRARGRSETSRLFTTYPSAPAWHADRIKRGSS